MPPQCVAGLLTLDLLSLLTFFSPSNLTAPNNNTVDLQNTPVKQVKTQFL